MTRQVPAVDPAEFRFCFAAGCAASEGRDQQFVFDPPSFELEGTVYTFTDNPVNRFMMAIKQRCKTEEEFMPIVMRMFALWDLLDSASKDQHTSIVRKSDDGHMKISGATLDIAATFPLKTRFNKLKFYKAISQKERKA